MIAAPLQRSLPILLSYLMEISGDGGDGPTISRSVGVEGQSFFPNPPKPREFPSGRHLWLIEKGVRFSQILWLERQKGVLGLFMLNYHFY